MTSVDLVETSVITRLRKPTIQAAIQRRGVVLVRSVVSDLEIGFSARNAVEWDAMLHELEVFVEVPLSAACVQRAKEVQRRLADRGLKGRKVPDLLIAASAEAVNATVVHYDGDFDLIAEVTGQPTRWVVPRGSID